MKRWSGDRAAFTLVELLVVIAIIGVLIGLLLPAVQQAREAARRMQCTNHLKQLGLAMHNYHDTHLTLPPGFIEPANLANFPNKNFWGWGAFILPYVEQQSIHDKIDFGYEWLAEGSAPNPNKGLSRTPIATFQCPTDTTGPTNAKVNDNGTSNYIASYGNKQVASPEYDSTDDRGMFTRNLRVGLEHVTDGTSNTILLGERTGQTINGVNFFGGIWAGVRSVDTNNNTGRRDLVLGRGPHGAANYVNAINGSNTYCLAHSLHPGGANFAMVDGSVRFLPETLNLITYRYLIQRDDGEVLASF